MNALNRSWLRAVRISAFCIFLIIFIVMVRMYASLLTHYDPEDSTSSRLQWAFPPSLLSVPYFWVFWRLRDISDAKRVKKALALAVSWGSLGSLCALGATVATWTEKDWPGTVMISIFALLQLVHMEHIEGSGAEALRSINAAQTEDQQGPTSRLIIGACPLF